MENENSVAEEAVALETPQIAVPQAVDVAAIPVHHGGVCGLHGCFEPGHDLLARQALTDAIAHLDSLLTALPEHRGCQQTGSARSALAFGINTLSAALASL